MNINAGILEWVFRAYVFIFLTVYGIGKLLGGQFYRRGNLPENVAQMTLENADGYSLAWTFMGYSNGYILFIGLTQLLGAFLLLWGRTKLLGTLVLIPIMVNVVAFDIFFLEPKGALVNAGIYLLMLFGILWINREKIISILKTLTIKTSTKLSLYSKENLLKWTLIAIIMAAIFVLDQFLVGWVGR